MLNRYQLGIIKSAKSEEYMIVIKASKLTKLSIFKSIKYTYELGKIGNALTMRGMIQLYANKRNNRSLVDDFNICGVKYKSLNIAWDKQITRVLDEFVREHGADADIPDDVIEKMDIVPLFESKYMAEKAIKLLI